MLEGNLEPFLPVCCCLNILVPSAVFARLRTSAQFMLTCAIPTPSHLKGSYGNPTSETPGLDQMAADGAKLLQYYSGASICTPSRGSLMTGRNFVRACDGAMVRGCDGACVRWRVCMCVLTEATKVGLIYYASYKYIYIYTHTHTHIYSLIKGAYWALSWSF